MSSPSLIENFFMGLNYIFSIEFCFTSTSSLHVAIKTREAIVYKTQICSDPAWTTVYGTVGSLLAYSDIH